MKHNCIGCNEHFKRKTDNCKYCNKAYQPKPLENKTENGLNIHLISDNRKSK